MSNANINDALEMADSFNGQTEQTSSTRKEINISGELNGYIKIKNAQID